MVNTRDKGSPILEHDEFEVEMSRGLACVAEEEHPWIGRALAFTFS